MTARALTFLVLKLAFAVGVVGVSSIYLVRLALPGGERRTSSNWIMMPFVAIVLLAAISLGLAPRSHWDEMVMGDQWLECLLSVSVSRSCLSPSLSLRREKRLRPIWSEGALSPISLQAA